MDFNRSKIDDIINLLEKLYCFSPDEVLMIKSKLFMMREPGVSKLLEVLREGKIKQDDLFAGFIERDSNFVKDFLNFLNGVSKKLKDKYEKQEKDDADLLLNEL